MALLTWKKFNMAAIQCEIKYFSENIFYNDKRKENIYSFKIISSINEIFCVAAILNFLAKNFSFYGK